MSEQVSKRVVLEPLPISDGGDVKFRLVLRGHLPPDKRGTVGVKHRIRRELHPQLKSLWQQHGLLRTAWKPRPNDSVVPVQELADNYAKCGFRFVPLVRSGMSCSLDFLILRRDEPHRLFSGGAGDLDSRVKTLIDSLRMPQQCAEVEGHAPALDEDPFFCLLEDDKHIFDFAVVTDRLLIPPEENEPTRDIVAIIGVHVRLALGAEFSVMANVSLYDSYGKRKGKD